ncbi:hypothetical protein LTR64_005375 [Lithohypha guttulata]|uniref:uncharacterized protein n=1 Tax=Lithohypha guttulata TaxID=1690604 RepID=UPI00315D24CA
MNALVRAFVAILCSTLVGATIVLTMRTLRDMVATMLADRASPPAQLPVLTQPAPTQHIPSESNTIRPTLAGLPTDVRARIFKHLFKGTNLHIPDYDDLVDTTDSTIDDFNTVRAVLQVNKQLRYESTSALEKSISITIEHNGLVKLAARVCPKLRELIVEEQPMTIKKYRKHLPHLQRIIVAQPAEDPIFYEELACVGWQQFFMMLCGHKDTKLLNDLKRLAKHVDRRDDHFRFLPRDMTVEKGETPCALIYRLDQMYIDCKADCKTGSYGISVRYRLDIDVTNWTIVYRGIDISSPSEACFWISAEEVVILTKKLERPVLYHPSTGYTRVLMWCIEDEEHERQGIYNDDWWDLREVSPVLGWEHRFCDERTLNRALESQCQCIPIDAEKRVKKAVKLLANKN